MKIKSFFAETVTDAVRNARQELGEDAMLVETRKAPPESQHLGEYEVVFAATGAEISNSGPSKGSSPVLATADMARLATEVARMRRQLEGMRLAMRSGVTAPRWLLPSSRLAGVFSTLLAADVATDVAQAIVDRLHAQAETTALENPAALETALAAELKQRFAVDATVGRGGPGPRMAALVGPPGSGKTTTLVKLAVACGLAERRAVQLISLDNLRVAAAEQLRSYAAILGAGYQALESAAALPVALAEHQQKPLILIDTPGFSAAEMDSAADLARALSLRPEIDVHLVLSASMKSADLMGVVEAFEIFRPAKLLFTRLDETGSFGPILSESARTRKRLSFLGTGQRIPEDLTAASPEMLIDLVLGDQRTPARQAA